jgi:fatty-acyl-CoA synthase
MCSRIGSKKATQVVVQAFEPGLVLELVARYRANAMVGVPTMHVALLEHPDFATTDLSSIEAIDSGGSLVPEALVRRLETELGAPFTIVFGQTECSPVASMTQTFDTIEDKSGTIGPPMPGVEIKIVDVETGETLPIGSIGEYCTRGYHVMREYFEMPERTAETIDEDGWLHTGDLCAMDDRGYCTVEGRLKDMIIRGGENIYPRELEELLFSHPAVGEVAIVGLPDEKMGEIVGAFIRPAPGTEVDKTELFEYLRESCSAQDTQTVVCSRGIPNDRLRQDPEVQAARNVGERRVERTLTTGPPKYVPIVALGATFGTYFRILILAGMFSCEQSARAVE